MTETPSQPKERLVRVFISSTFRDMNAEREELGKFIFPELRRFCREREVEFVEVDLRWGVTEEQSQRGETLAVCLAEIDYAALISSACWVSATAGCRVNFGRWSSLKTPGWQS